MYLGEEQTSSGERRWFALNEYSEEIWSWAAPADYDPHARVAELYPEVFEAAAAGDPQAQATWKVLQRLHDPARLVIELDVLHQDEAVKYVWADSLYLPEEAPMAMGAGGGGGPPAAPESGGAFEIASIARYGDGLRLTLTNTVAGEAYQIEWKRDLLPESVDWSVVASGSANQTVFDLPMPQYRSGVFRAAQIEEPTVATPEFSPSGGTYSGPTNAAVTCATEGAAILYTTNGVDPTALDLYVPNGGSIELTEGVTLKARGFHADLAQSAVASATYTIPSSPDASAGDQQILTGSTTNTTMEGSVSGAGPFTITWSKLSGPGTVTFGDASQTNTTASFSQDGIYQLQMIACDGSLCSTDVVIIAINPTLAVEIAEPDDLSSATMPTNLLLRAEVIDGTATQVAFYADGVYIDAATKNPFGVEWKNVPAGTHELVAIAHSADTNNAMIESDPISITVNWTEDVGNFALSATDLQIPVPGAPIAVTRTYETRYDDGGEVGKKWKLDHEWVKAEKSGAMYTGWRGVVSAPAGCVEETTEHLVTVRLGEHESYHFLVQIAFTHPLYGGGPCIINDTNPNLYRGYNVRYEFLSLTGEGELVAENQRIDRNDNKLTYDSYGITYSHPGNGGAERYVKFTRYDGHITEVYDPNSLNASGQTNGPPAVKYSYDASGNLTNVARLVDRDVPTYENTAYACTNATYPSHITHAYDSLNRLTNLTAKVGTATRATFTYTLAADGIRTNLAETVNSQSRAFAWAYDNLRRLKTETITGTTPTGTVSYQYDAVGNRTNRTSTVSGVSSATYAYDSNDRLTTDGYDSAGNTTNSSGNVYEYDIDGRLTEATVGGQTVAYTYNADGHRISKIAGGVTNWYLVDTLNLTSYAQVLEEHTNTNLTRVYTYGLDLISQHGPAATNTHYYGYDGNGNTRYLTDEAGAVTDTYVYEAFGTEIASSGSTTNLYRYTGEQYDPNLGFYYLRARYLNPSSGRFWTMDPFAGLIKDPASLHKYLYASVNPVNNVDPSGEMTLIGLTIRVGIVAAVVGTGYYVIQSGLLRTATQRLDLHRMTVYYESREPDAVQTRVIQEASRQLGTAGLKGMGAMQLVDLTDIRLVSAASAGDLIGVSRPGSFRIVIQDTYVLLAPDPAAAGADLNDINFRRVALQIFGEAQHAVLRQPDSQQAHQDLEQAIQDLRLGGDAQILNWAHGGQ